MRAKAVDLFHAYLEYLFPPAGAVIVAARDEGESAPLTFLLADFLSLESIEHRPAGLEIAARGKKLEWRFDSGEGDPRLELTEAAFSGPRALFMRRPAGKDFAFLFPRSGETRNRLRQFLVMTFVAESGLPPASAQTAAERIIALWASSQKGNS